MIRMYNLELGPHPPKEGTFNPYSEISGWINGSSTSKAFGIADVTVDFPELFDTFFSKAVNSSGFSILAQTRNNNICNFLIWNYSECVWISFDLFGSMLMYCVTQHIYRKRIAFFDICLTIEYIVISKPFLTDIVAFCFVDFIEYT